MEFLDDLIKNQDTEDQPEQENEPRDAAWNDLISGAAFEDPLEQDVADNKNQRERLGLEKQSQNRKKDRPARRRLRPPEGGPTGGFRSRRARP